MATVTVTKIQARRSKTAAYRPPTTGNVLSDGEPFYNLIDGQARIGGLAADIPLLVATNAEAIAGTAAKIVTPPGLVAAANSIVNAAIAALVITVDGGQEG